MQNQLDSKIWEKSRPVIDVIGRNSDSLFVKLILKGKINHDQKSKSYVSLGKGHFEDPLFG